MSSDMLWKEIADLRERVKELEKNVAQLGAGAQTHLEALRRDVDGLLAARTPAMPANGSAVAREGIPTH